MTSTLTSDDVRPDDAFNRARAGLQQLNASPWEWDVVETLARHGVEEGAVLTRYEALANESESAAVRYLVGLILDEERRHHRVLAQLAETIAWSASPPLDGDLIPELRRGRRDSVFRQTTKELLDAERADRKELRALLKRMKEMRNTTLWSLLLELLVDDTNKHIRILTFLRRNAAEA